MSKRVRSIVFAVATLALLAFVSPAGAQELEDFLGAWEVVQQMQGNETTIVVTFVQAEDGTLSGTWESPRGTADLQDVAYADGTLTFTREMGGGPQGEGQGGTTQGVAMLQDGDLHLKMTTPRGERELIGKRRES